MAVGSNSLCLIANYKIALLTMVVFVAKASTSLVWATIRGFMGITTRCHRAPLYISSAPVKPRYQLKLRKAYGAGADTDRHQWGEAVLAMG